MVFFFFTLLFFHSNSSNKLFEFIEIFISYLINEEYTQKQIKLIMTIFKVNIKY